MTPIKPPEAKLPANAAIFMSIVSMAISIFIIGACLWITVTIVMDIFSRSLPAAAWLGFLLVAAIVVPAIFISARKIRESYRVICDTRHSGGSIQVLSDTKNIDPIQTPQPTVNWSLVIVLGSGILYALTTGKMFVLICAVLIAAGMIQMPYFVIRQAMLSYRYPQVLQSASQLLKSNPKFAMAAMANAYAGMNQLNQALEYCNKVIELEPKNVIGLIVRASVRSQLGQLDEALADCSEAVKHSSTAIPAQLGKCDVLLRMGKSTEASSELKAISSIKQPKLILSYLHCYYSLVYLSLGDIPEARRAAETAVLMNKDCADAHCALAIVLLREKDYDAALTELSKALILNPYSAQASWYRQKVYLAIGKIALAQDESANPMYQAYSPYPFEASELHEFER